MFDRITLEMSLKPFKKTDDDYIREVCKKTFEDWRALLKGRKTIAVMLWCADGSELLDWSGELDEEFEWCEWIGTANREKLDADEPLETSLHRKKQPYMKNPPRMTYRILKNIVTMLKEEGKKAFPSADIRVGETFDIGPEFALSTFKYERHPEISTGQKLDKLGFVDSTACLHADSRKYAAYPSGIPEGLKFGTFLGKQAAKFLPDMGFDYLWLSNGLGFSADPWTKTGKVFDGENYYPEKLKETKKKVFEFWNIFREACPDIPLEVRGTNNSVGIDYATDGVPLWDIYNADLDIVAPPNSPWAALNDNFGLEIMGHLTRTAELPNSVFPFRYYIHDPWWVNSPWYDRYDGAPHDIYMPMALSRVNKDGKVEAANTFNILTIDNSFGDMPAACINEPLPHILKAEKDAPDAIAPIVWVYPMREYTTTEDAGLLKEMNEGDNFVQDAVNVGFPLTGVVSTDNFELHDPKLYKKSILLSPVPCSEKTLEKLERAARCGTGVIIYGTGERFEKIKEAENLKKVDTGMGVGDIMTALASFGYAIKFDTEDPKRTSPVLLHLSDGALWLNVYSRDTTTEVRMKTPLGAPAPLGMETKMSDGESLFRFGRAEHRECRVFIEQEDGVVSVRENQPVSGRFRRAIKVRGLKNATLRYLPESGYEEKIYLAAADNNIDFLPELESDKVWYRVHDEKFGDYMEAKNVSGSFYILTEYPERFN